MVRFGIKKRIVNLILRYKYRKRHVHIDLSANLSRDVQLDDYCRIFEHTTFRGSLGYGSYISSNCRLEASIGRFCSIGPNVTCNPGTHAYKEPYATTSPLFFSKNMNGATFAQEQMFEEYTFVDKEKQLAFKVGNDCWIGESVFIVGGVTLADGAMVLAHAVVTKDVPPYAIVGGVPAKIVGYRYDEETIKFLLNVQWWNQSTEWFKRHWRLLNDIEQLKSYYKNKNKDGADFPETKHK